MREVCKATGIHICCCPLRRLPVGTVVGVCYLFAAPNGAAVVPWGCHLCVHFPILCFLANSRTIKSISVFYQTFITVQDIERSG